MASPSRVAFSLPKLVSRSDVTKALHKLEVGFSEADQLSALRKLLSEKIAADFSEEIYKLDELRGWWVVVSLDGLRNRRMLEVTESSSLELVISDSLALSAPPAKRVKANAQATWDELCGLRDCFIRHQSEVDTLDNVRDENLDKIWARINELSATTAKLQAPANMGDLPEKVNSMKRDLDSFRTDMDKMSEKVIDTAKLGETVLQIDRSSRRNNILIFNYKKINSAVDDANSALKTVLADKFENVKLVHAYRRSASELAPLLVELSSPTKVNEKDVENQKKIQAVVNKWRGATNKDFRRAGKRIALYVDGSLSKHYDCPDSIDAPAPV
ncbi:hypothetical protein H072_3589 [Dactylellina haptotyla CBS 200.50]|uniref:Uncharacterized protein n=1 Tax=Dactylellina haptotyla (strain CBS 200.50) TaxID=1284197 RepID=S8BSL2_DACHA|nr:hypothetical protein H072_3589 [Dactylellina haptotyla CBS 200.50]